MPRGGKQPNSGRKPGSPNVKNIPAKNILNENRELLVNKAVYLATKKNPNIPILLKLLDKVAPSLTSSKIEADVTNRLPFEDLNLDSIVEVLKEYTDNKETDTKSDGTE